MFIVLGIMFCGVAAGWLLRTRAGLRAGAARLVMPVIYALLFVMGITVGSNEQIMSNLATLGLQALALTVGAVVGSVCMAWLVWRRFLEKNMRDEK